LSNKKASFTKIQATLENNLDCMALVIKGPSEWEELEELSGSNK
jgi:hypothetical protein